MTEGRRKKVVKLNKLQSISGAGNNTAHIECHRCGEKGHKMRDCASPDGKRRSGYDGDRPKKRSKQAEALDY